MCMLKYLLIKSKNIFECFICFWKWFYTFVLFVFVQNAFLCFSSKTSSEAILRKACDLELPAKYALEKLTSHIFIQRVSLLPREYFMTKHFSRNVFRQKLKILNFTQRLLRLSRDCFTTKSFSRKLQCVSRLISWLPNPRERVFSILYSRCDGFSKTLYFPRIASLEPLSTQNHFSLKPQCFQACFLHLQLQGMSSKTFSSCLCRIMQKLS